MSRGRKIAMAVDLSEESAYAVRWAVENYLRAGDAVTVVHVRPTSALYGADWGPTEEAAGRKMEADVDRRVADRIAEVARPLGEAGFSYRVHVVRDHDMKERLCLEIERLGMSAVIMGSRGFGAAAAPGRKAAMLGSVSNYCVHHCACPVVVVRFHQGEGEAAAATSVPEVGEQLGLG